MSKPRGVEWLEQETGQKLDRWSLSGDDGRHLSLRISTGFFAQLEQVAADRNETVSQTARRLLTDGLARIDDPDREAIDAAIAALERLRRTRDPSTA